MAFNQQGFFPQNGGFGQPMQPMFQTQPTQPMQFQLQGQAPEQPLFCRAVTNREEVQAWPVDFNGRPMTFLGPNLQTVWIKIFNPSTGGSDVVEYRIAAPAKAETAKTPTMDEFLSLQELVQRQGDEIARLRGASRRRSNREQEVSDDEV